MKRFLVLALAVSAAALFALPAFAQGRYVSPRTHSPLVYPGTVRGSHGGTLRGRRGDAVIKFAELALAFLLSDRASVYVDDSRDYYPVDRVVIDDRRGYDQGLHRGWYVGRHNGWNNDRGNGGYGGYGQRVGGRQPRISRSNSNSRGNGRTNGRGNSNRHVNWRPGGGGDN